MGDTLKKSILLICFSVWISSTFTAGSSDQKLVCYMELWANSRPSPMDYSVEDLPEGKCDYLVLMFLTLNAVNYGLELNNGYTDVDPMQLKSAVEARSKDPNMKVLVAVGGWHDGVAKYSDMLSERPKRKLFINSVVQTLEEYDLDGVDLHWKYPGATWRGGRTNDKGNLEQLVKELTLKFKEKNRNWILTASIPAEEKQLDDGYIIPRLNSFLHHFHVLTIDLRGPWSKKAENHSPLYARQSEDAERRYLNVNDTIAMLKRKGASPRKLVPVFPLFGRTFTLLDPKKNTPGAKITGPGNMGPFTTAAELLAYFEVCDLLQSQSWTRVFDHTTQTPYAVKDNQWVGYDDEESLQKKAKFVTDQGLPGAALFAISMDDFTGTCGPKNFLLNKMRDYLNDNDNDNEYPDPRHGS